VSVVDEARSAAMRKLSPLRNSTSADRPEDLAKEQLAHFGIDPATSFGEALLRTTERLYESQADFDRLWQETMQSIHELPRADRIAYFNAKKFLSFQLAKILDTLQNPFRQSYQ